MRLDFASRPGMTAPSIRALGSTFVLALALAACGGGGGDGTSPPPPPDNTVASVGVNPPTASVEVAATVQLTATPRNAAGTALSGKAITWASNAQAIATVTNAGLVTGVASGTATITATAEGRTGTATITVSQGTSQVVASGIIGPAGGTIASDDVGLTIPAGALADSRRIEILVTDQASNQFGAYAAAKEFRLNGFPADRRADVTVRLRQTSALDGVSLIGYGKMVRTSDEAATPELRYRVTPAKDSSGWLVATISVTGKPAVQLNTAPGFRATVASANGIVDLLDGYIIGVKSADTLSTAHFQVVSYGAPRATLQPLLPVTLGYLEEAFTAITGMGYAFDFRKRWPISVSVRPMPEHPTWYAFFNTEGGFPADPETGFMEFNSLQAAATALWPGVAIHEFFHFEQTRYGTRRSDAMFLDSDWFNEATSSWIMERAPSNTLANKNTFFYGWRDSLFTGIHPALNANGGYGKGALIKYIADRWGDATLRNIYTAFNAGTPLAEAFVNALPVPATTWWPDFLVAYMGNQVYSLTQDELLPGTRITGDIHPGTTAHALLNAFPASARVVRLRYSAEEFGSGSNLTVRFRQADSLAFKFLAFQANDAGSWTPLGPVADTLFIPGATLKQGKSIVLFAIRPDALAPCTGVKNTGLVYDFGLQDGDWLADHITGVADNIVYTRTEAGDTTKIVVSENVEDVSRLFGSLGTWIRDPKLVEHHYTWTTAPEVADTLAKLGIRMSGTIAPVPGAVGWDYVVKARFEMGGASAGMTGTASILWYLLPIGFLPFLRHRRTRKLAAFAVVSMTSALWACDIGSFAFAVKASYEFELPEAAIHYTAEAGDSAVALVTYEGAPGKVTIEEYRSEYWSYIRDDQGEKVDSVQQIRTGAGTATFTHDAKLFFDGKTPKAPGDDDDGTAAVAARLLQLPLGTVQQGMRRMRVPR